MAFDFDKWMREANGKAFDVDGSYGAQCVDGFNYYLRALGGGHVSGNAVDLWTNRNSNGILNYFDVVSSPKNGDVVVWSVTYGPNGEVNNFGHVAMYYDGGYFGQNQGATSSEWGGPFNWIGSVTGTIAGYFRPKKEITSAGGAVGGGGSGTIDPNPPAKQKSKIWMKIVNGFVVEAKIIS